MVESRIREAMAEEKGKDMRKRATEWKESLLEQHSSGEARSTTWTS
jgi:hypothetical protein